jgi:hypothetical protein
MVYINQNDPDEKSEQVSIMGEIYRRATKVYAWLGEADRQIDCVFDVLQEFRDRKKEAKFPTHFDAAEQLSYHRQLFRDSSDAESFSFEEFEEGVGWPGCWLLPRMIWSLFEGSKVISYVTLEPSALQWFHLEDDPTVGSANSSRDYIND